jgi:predicted flap endonuclease-1-like 5' DNA nuclease
MLNLLSVTDILVLAQEPGGPVIPLWVWILLGIILVVVVMGLILGSRTTDRKSPTVRSTNVSESTTVEPAQNDRVRPEMIPQTGSEVLHDIAPAEESVQDVEGPLSTDDLTVIHGITPNIAQMLNNAGITRFRQLANTDPRELNTMMERTGHENVDPFTWPEQARLAEEGRFDELDRFDNRV